MGFQVARARLTLVGFSLVVVGCGEVVDVPSMPRLRFSDEYYRVAIEDYDVSCVEDEDCALVQDYCPLANACPDTSVNTNAVEEFDLARQELTCPDPQTNGFCPSYRAFCVAGSCEVCSLDGEGHRPRCE